MIALLIVLGMFYLMGILFCIVMSILAVCDAHEARTGAYQVRDALVKAKLFMGFSLIWPLGLAAMIREMKEYSEDEDQ